MAKSELKVEIMVAPCTEWTPPNPVRLDQSRDLNHTAYFPPAARPKPQRQDRRYRAVYELFSYFLQKFVPIQTLQFCYT